MVCRLAQIAAERRQPDAHGCLADAARLHVRMFVTTENCMLVVGMRWLGIVM